MYKNLYKRNPYCQKNVMADNITFNKMASPLKSQLYGKGQLCNAI